MSEDLLKKVIIERRNRGKCFMCEDKKFYYNAAGDWILCQRCDIIRMAKWLQEEKE